MFVYLLVGALLPKIAAIAATTSKESMGQPLYYVVMAIGAFGLLLVRDHPLLHVWRGRQEWLKDTGLTSIMLLSLIVAVWSASVSIADEIEGSTALTLLSKPVRRLGICAGQDIGIFMARGAACSCFLGTALVCSLVSYKVVYDAREVAQTEVTNWQCLLLGNDSHGGSGPPCWRSSRPSMLTSISVAISTRLRCWPI